jgi:predicted HTH transcriptional regulator
MLKFITLTVLAIVIVGLLVFRKTREPIMGICATAIGLDAKKKERKEKILGLLGEGGELSNSDIREALRVSAATARRYMDELEREGKAEQVGKVGHAVTYRLK